MKENIGRKVIINDHSIEAQGDEGVIVDFLNGYYYIEMPSGYLWPTESHELIFLD